MTEEDGDKHLLLLLSVGVCIIASIGGDIAANPQLNEINVDSMIKLDINSQNTLITRNMLINEDINPQNLKKAINILESSKIKHKY